MAIGTAAALIGSAVIGAGASAISGSKAASAQKKAAAQSDATQRYFYDTGRADLAPQREIGYGALDKLASMFGVQRQDASGKPIGVASAAGVGYSGDTSFMASPGYQFRRDEGLRAINRSNAARGILNSGGADKARMRYADGIASSEYDTYANRLAALAGVGQTATGQTVQVGQNAANNISQNQLAAGNARASSYASAGSAVNQGVNNLASIYLYQKGGGFGSGSGGFGPGFLDD